MGLRINNNIAAMNAYRNLSATDSSMSKSLEKLSSGFRINRAADDAAGLSISEGLRSQIGGLKQAVRNAQDGVNVVQTADGALTETTAILQRMRDLAVQAANTGSQDVSARTAAQTEITQLNAELDRIGSTTAFGGAKLLDGSYGLQGAVTAAGTQVDLTAVNATSLASTAALSVTLDSTSATGTVVAGSAVTVNLTNTAAGASAATYTNDVTGAASLQADLQKDIDATSLKGQVTAKVSYDALTNKTSVSFARTTASGAKDGLTVANGTGTPATALGFSTSAALPSGTAASFQVGANNTTADKITIAIGKVNSTALNVNAVDVVNNAASAIDSIDAAVKSVSTTRANLGAYQNRFEHTINNLNVTVQNLTASESQIRDTDMAQEMTNFTRNQILSQAGTAMLAQANQASQGVLQLLRG